MRIPITIFWCLLSLSTFTFAEDFTLTGEMARFDIHIQHKLILVEASVDEKTGYFIFDTGAPRLLLNYAHFADAPQFHSNAPYLDIVGRKSDMQQALVQAFHWGAITRTNFWTPSTDLSHLEELLGVPILGLIGYEVFRSFEILIQYDDRLLLLYPLDQRGKSKLVPPKALPDHTFGFRMEKHLPILRAKMGKHHHMYLALDSGASINIMDSSWHRRLTPFAHRSWKITYQGLKQHAVETSFLAFPNLLVQERMLFMYWKAAFSDLAHFREADIRIDGFLGINFFQVGTTIINYQTQTIAIWEGTSVFTQRYTTLKE